MRVYICYNCYYDYLKRETFETVVKAVDSLEKAEVWVKNYKKTESHWRIYRGMDVE